ncbi:MAG: hypothetical protein LJE70_07365 [Chromatiaceae bacterium]|nr:hypothetical protein [Chromatiaceae bacterium]
MTEALVAILSGCATAPKTGRLQLILISLARETKMGFNAFQEMRRKKPVVGVGSESNRVRRVGSRIAALERRMPEAMYEYDRAKPRR